MDGMGNGWNGQWNGQWMGPVKNGREWMEWGSKRDFLVGMGFAHDVRIIRSYLAVWPRLEESGAQSS